MFNLYAPEAIEVALAGSWMSNPWSGEKMTQQESGVWTLTTGPLPDDLYTYSYSVQGVKTMDPNNIMIVRDGSRYNNCFVIPGERSSYYEMREVPHGSLSRIWYDSPVLGMKRRMTVYTPPGYENGKGHYPVLYLLHGLGGDEDT